jgi:putative transposase
MLFLGGISTRTLAMISHRLIGRNISSREVSRCSQELVQAIEKWRNRDLSLVRFKYLFCDGVFL